MPGRSNKHFEVDNYDDDEGSDYSEEEGDVDISYSDDDDDDVDAPRGKQVAAGKYDEEDYGYEEVQPRTRAPSPNRLDRGGVSSRRKQGGGAERRSSGKERRTSGKERSRAATGGAVQRHTGMNHVDGSDHGDAPPASARRGVPRRAKSSEYGSESASARGGGRRPPARSHSSDMSGYRGSGERMPRRERSGTQDPKIVASNRARRLRAVGDAAGPRRPKLESASSARRVTPSRSLSCGPGLDPAAYDDTDDSAAAAAATSAPALRQAAAANRSMSMLKISSDAPEERQYARTAARGVTRTKSLKSSAVSTRDVASKLQAMRQHAEDKKPGGGAARDSPKSTTQLKW